VLWYIEKFKFCILFHYNAFIKLQCIGIWHFFFFVYFQSWDAFFRNSSAGASPGQAYQSPPSLALPGRNETALANLAPFFGGPAISGQVDDKVIDDHLAVQAIIRSYQVCILKINLVIFLVLNNGDWSVMSSVSPNRTHYIPYKLQCCILLILIIVIFITIIATVRWSFSHSCCYIIQHFTSCWQNPQQVLFQFDNYSLIIW
jgi:hypothetical protein